MSSNRRDFREQPPMRRRSHPIVTVTISVTITLSLVISVWFIFGNRSSVQSGPNGGSPTQNPGITPTIPPTIASTQPPSTLRPTGNFPATSVDHVFGNCIGVEVIPHHDPTLGVDWNPDADYQVNGQPVAMEEWSNAKPGSQNQSLYKLYLPNGFVDSSGHTIVFPSGGGMIVVFAKGCENAAQQWYAADSSPNSATADQLISIGNAKES